MADHSEVAYTTADGNDYVAHEQTYIGFLTLVKWGTLSIIAILVLTSDASQARQYVSTSAPQHVPSVRQHSERLHR